MSEKQIEEKQKIISDICPFFKEYGTCEQCNTEFDINDEPCYWECMARAIINNDYRKASEVAKEIEGLRAFKAYFDDLYGKGLEVANWHLNGELESFDNFFESALAELKKKYTEGEYVQGND